MAYLVRVALEDSVTLCLVCDKRLYLPWDGDGAFGCVCAPQRGLGVKGELVLCV